MSVSSLLFKKNLFRPYFGGLAGCGNIVRMIKFCANCFKYSANLTLANGSSGERHEPNNTKQKLLKNGRKTKITRPNEPKGAKHDFAVSEQLFLCKCTDTCTSWRN